MKLRLFVAIAAVFCLCSMAAAQSYHIRVTHNSNLRATHSLEGDIIETAPAGATLHVVGKVNRWLKIDRNGNEVWMADWIDYTRVENSAQPAAQTGASTVIDNCCFVDRQCQSDQEWTNGYWAYQNGQCAAPAQSQSGTTPPPASNAAGPIDNCCFAGWHCQSELEWAQGYYAYRDNQCEATPGARTPVSNADTCCHQGWDCTIPSDWILGESVYALFDGECLIPETSSVDGVIIEGSDAFVVKMKEALDLLKNRAPQWYAYVIKAPFKIRQSYWSGASNTLERSINVQAFEVFANTVRQAHVLVHEACHIQRWLAGLHRYETDLQQRKEEALCELVVDYMLDSVRPFRPRNDSLEAEVNRLISEGVTNIRELANTERHRAYHLLSTMN